MAAILVVADERNSSPTEPGEPSEAKLASIAASSGVGSDAGTSSAEAVAVVAERSQEILLQNPSSGYNHLVVDEELRTVHVWRTTPSTAVDNELLRIAEDENVELVLTEASFDASELQALGSRLFDRNDEWRMSGWEVDAFYVTPTGLTVLVDGDITVARVVLEQHSEITTIDVGGTRSMTTIVTQSQDRTP